MRALITSLSAFALTVLAVGCTGPLEYVTNGFKVGPNYKKPPAPVAQHWIDEGDKRLRTDDSENLEWWTVFGDPVLDNLIKRAARENLTLKQAGQRVLEFRAARAITVGNLFPQLQTANGYFSQNAISNKAANTNFPFQQHFFNQWDGGFNLAWELDFWGRFRRAIESADGALNASVEDYDDVLVTLIGDVATAYVTVRTYQTKIKLAKDNVAIQQENLTIAEAQFKAGKTSKIDVDQALTTLGQVEALIPQFEIELRHAQNQLCILLGIPPQDLEPMLGISSIPKAPPEVIVGIPAQLLTRRPDVRRAERLAAAQSARIGIAEADFYPAISINGNIAYQAAKFQDLFDQRAMAGSWGPAFQWNILNYGRILNNVRLQDAKFQELVLAYQATVLKANGEVENAIVTYLKSHQTVRALLKSVEGAEEGVRLASVQYREGKIPFVVLSTLQQNLVTQQDSLATAYGQLVVGLVQTYRALGGGWQIRLRNENWLDNLAPPREVPSIRFAEIVAPPIELPAVPPAAKPAAPAAPGPQGAMLGLPVPDLGPVVGRRN